MSASTVSITANTAAAVARRRPVVAGEKKSNNVELLPAEPQLNGTADAVDPNNAAGGAADKVMATSVSRDFSHHSIRGEAVLERTSKDPAHFKRNPTNSTLSPVRRTRKQPSKPEKPRWQTVLSIFTKNFVLLLILVGLAQLVRRVALKPGEDFNSAAVGTQFQLGLSEFEGRIAEVESLLKTTAKMMQVQVEVVDKKIENEVGGLRREMSKKIDETGQFLESELKKLVDRSEDLENSMKELKAAEWLSKEEFGRFYEELKKSRGGDELGKSDIGLDDIRVYAKKIVQREIEKHAADGLGRVDYALYSGGAFVLEHSEPFLPRGFNNWFLAGRLPGVHAEAVKMLKPSFGEPGQCFPLRGDAGFVVIKLRTAIIPEAVTLEHVAKSVAYDRSSAPKDCRVSGWLRRDKIDSAADPNAMFFLTEFTYDLEKSSAQTFNVLESAASQIVDTVRLDFTSNHGSHTHTCIYRIRVHGREPDSVSMMAM